MNHFNCNQYSLGRKLLLSLITLGFFSLTPPVLADEPGVDKLLLTPEKREEIDQQRDAYLKSQLIGEVEPEEEKKPEKKAKGPYKPRSPLPSKLAVTAVIEEPKGKKVVRVNGKYYDNPTRKIPVQMNQTSTKGVVIKDGKKVVVVPVGSTYLSRKNKVVESYKLNKQTGKKDTQPEKKILKADNQAVKETLKDVKTVTTPQQ